MLSAAKEPADTLIPEKPVKQKAGCYHCGTECQNETISLEGKYFCCEGCKLVYEILDQNGLCDYYKIQNHPGLSQIKPARNDKYAWLDNEELAAKMYQFTDGNHSIVTLYIPGVHCSSCMWLLEHLHRLNPGISESRLNFSAKEVTVHFRKEKTSLRKVVELLMTIGYEPYISLDDAEGKQQKKQDKKKIYKLGIAGFCFGNIMMLAIPDYLAFNTGLESQYARLFIIISLILSVPVFFYCASEFFTSAWAGLKQKILNIDAPIALALMVTYGRSLYEISTGIGGGYLDSMSGIVFFMLVGRIVQERTYRSISFHRDYKSYFPIAVDVITEKGTVSKSLQDLKEKDLVQLHHDEVIPADALLVQGRASIDYSFVTGESEPVSVIEGQTLYAGGRQTGEQIKVQILRPVAGSYLTDLWNHYAFRKDKAEQNKRESIIHRLSSYFTYVLFVLAALTAAFWAWKDPSRILPSVSAMLIVACPCALLLAATYTNGNLLRLFSNNGLFLRDATIIEQLGNINHIVFDKTGTLTKGSFHLASERPALTEREKDLIYAVAKSSKHPYSKALSEFTGERKPLKTESWSETAGKGIDAYVEGFSVKIGSAAFVNAGEIGSDKASVFVRINDRILPFYLVPDFRESVPQIIPKLNNDYELSLLSGDNDRQKEIVKELFSKKSRLLFEQKPVDKLNFIGSLQEKGEKVMMIGDGLNDSGALQQSNVGITLADDINNFTPSCDAILDARRFDHLPSLLKLARSGRFIINLSFTVSVLYNIIGLAISMQAKMSPMIAAILMPASTLSIVLISTGMSSLAAGKLGLSLKGYKK